MNWRQKAACAGADPELFFPGPGNPALAAKRICADCPVRQQCLETALRNNEQNGIWGGMNIDQRRLVPRPCDPDGPELCNASLHILDDASTRIVTVNGKQYRQCRPCARARETERRAAERVRLTGSSSPRSGVPLEKRRNYATITAELQRGRQE